MSDGLSGDRDPLVVDDVKYRLAQNIIDQEEDSTIECSREANLLQDTQLQHNTELLFGGISGAAGYDDLDLEYMRVFGSIIYDPV